MTLPKGGSQEAPGKTRVSSNSLNPDAPEFNPRSKSTGKLNANAPEFVPGQLHNFESVMLNMPEMKGYKNGHMPAYTISHQEQCVPVWVPQAYPVNVPIPHFYNNVPIDLISCDFTQTQNYPIQRNVYPTQPHNDYHLNPPYNVVAQGKSKLNAKATKARPPVKDASSKEPARDHSRDKEAAVSARDNISVATTKDTTRDAAVTPTKEVTPEPTKPLTWAERTKMSTRQPPKPAVAQPVHTQVPTSAATLKELPKDTVKEHRHPPREVAKESKDHVKDTSSKEVSRTTKDDKERTRERDRERQREDLEKTDKELSRATKDDKETPVKHFSKDSHEQVSYAKVFKDAVKSNAASTSSTVSTATTVGPKESRPEQKEPVKEVVRSTVSTLAASKDLTTTLSSEVVMKHVSATSSSTSTDADVTYVTDTTVTEVAGESEDSTKTKDASNEYSVDTMLGYYVYLLKNRKMVDEIREKYQLPKLNFSTTTSSSTPNKSGYKDRERDRDRSDKDRDRDRDRDRSSRDDRDRNDKSDKKDWRHKSYDKNFGNNFRFNNKEFSRASNEFTPAVVASESSWVIKQAKQKSDKEAVLRRKIMGLLNRLTFEKFDIIYKQIIECGIDTPEHAEMLVRFVFGKAVTQHHFIPMYVELCAKLAIDLYTIDSGASANGAAASVSKPTSAPTDSSSKTEDASAKDSRIDESTSGSVDEKFVKADDKDSEKLELDKNAVDKLDGSDRLEGSVDLSVERSESGEGKVEDTEGQASLEKERTENAESDQKMKERDKEEQDSGELRDEEKDQSKLDAEKDQTTHDTTAKSSERSEQVVASSSVEGVPMNPDELVDAKNNRKSDFMRILLNCSQDSFEDNLKPLEIPAELEGDDRFEYEQKYKHKMRGNMIFVGELFKQKLLAAKLLITCLDQVFSKREECILLYDDVNMGNNHLEAMCTLLQTVGRSFDTNRWKHLSEFEKRIQHLEDLGKNELISFRIRCLIKNVLDSRMEHWDKSIYQKQDQPCKLQELRHRHSSSSINLLTSTNSSSNLNASSSSNRDRDRSDKDRDRDRDRERSSRDDRDEVWRMRNKKTKSSGNLTAFGKSERSRKELGRNMSRDSFSESMESRRGELGRDRDRERSSRDREREREKNTEKSEREEREFGRSSRERDTDYLDSDKERTRERDRDRERQRDLEKTDKERSDSEKSDKERKYRDREREKYLKDTDEDSEMDRLDDLEEEDEDVSDLDDSEDRSDRDLDYLDNDNSDEQYYGSDYRDLNRDRDRSRNKNEESDEDYPDNDNEKLYKNVRSIVSELVLSHDVEESSTRVEELNLEQEKFNDFYRLLVVTCMENCSKVNADKESQVVTRWIVDLAKQQDSMSSLVDGLHEFVFGEDENCMSILVEDFPLLPKTLKLLLDNMSSECNQNQKFKEILAQV